jgi:hypothetical protein
LGVAKLRNWPSTEIFEAETKRRAIKIAKSLRALGMQVAITGPDGNPVDEKEDQ